jgi:hypothetical protein
VLDLWPRLGAKTGEFFRLLSHNPPAKGQMTQEQPANPFHQLPMDPKNDEQWPEMVIWSVVVVEYWICGREWGQKQVSLSHF